MKGKIWKIIKDFSLCLFDSYSKILRYEWVFIVNRGYRVSFLTASVGGVPCDFHQWKNVPWLKRGWKTLNSRATSRTRAASETWRRHRARRHHVTGVHARGRHIRAHAQFIVLTENAVGFENGGQCVPADRETYTLYVSKGAAGLQRNRTPRQNLACTRTYALTHFLHSSTLVCVKKKTWCFSWLCGCLTSHSKQRMHTDDANASVINAGVSNPWAGLLIALGVCFRGFHQLWDCCGSAVMS